MSVDRSLDINTTQKGAVPINKYQLLGEEKKILDGNLDAVLFAFSRTWLVGAAANHAGVQVGESNNLFLCLQCTAARLRV
mmetsp:Transcript_65729/g.173531  ORF Transcript_65729/g.173531 Transcript_65729/m.173531 type:complete len:80 (-) Transcript_65729:145-384(-)